MARKANFIEEINPTKDTWKLKIRITSLWRVEKSSTPSLEMVFMDVKGHKIQAGVKNYLLAQWESQLKEGNSYIAENFVVVPNDGQYRAADHPFKIIFDRGTIMKCQELPEIPQNIFHFTSFKEILDGLASSDVLVDVIGELGTIEMSQVDSSPKKVVFSMKDQRDDQVRCTLWGQFATQLLTFEANHKKGPIVVLLTLAKIREQKGGYPLSIQNTMYGSKLYINDGNIAEIQHYLKSLNSDQIYESYSQRLSQSSSSSQFSGSQGKPFLNAEIKHIAEINQTTKEFNCVTVGKIDKLFANGWYYDGCPQCNKKLPVNNTNRNCPGCGKYLTEILPRYRVEVNVTYDNESIKCVLWNGNMFFIPRMSLSPSQSPWPFKLMRRQFPLIVSYAMTINKSQGQSLASVGLYLPRPVFSHGQLYVALSRVQSKQGLKILIHDKEGKSLNTTINVVFKEVFQNL